MSAPVPPAGADMLLLEEAARMLRISESTAARLCERGFPSMKILSTWRMSGPCVRAALAAMDRGPVDLLAFARQWTADQDTPAPLCAMCGADLAVSTP